MNEKLIELLWWKARIGYNNQQCDPEVLAKFAELIIRECCKEITQEPFNAGAASLWLKDYFGVEE